MKEASDEFVPRAGRDLAHARSKLQRALLAAAARGDDTSVSRDVAGAQARVVAIRGHIDYYTELLGLPPYEEPEVPGIREASTVTEACEEILRVCVISTTREMTTMLVESKRVRARCAYNIVARALTRDERFEKIGRAQWTLRRHSR